MDDEGIRLSIRSYSPKKGDVLVLAVGGNPTMDSVVVIQQIAKEVLDKVGASAIVVSLSSYETLDSRLIKTLLSREELIKMGRCPECMVAGQWQAMAMVCHEHGPFLGGAP